LRYHELTHCIVGLTWMMDFGHMHLMGNDIVVRLNWPWYNFLPIILTTSTPDDLCLDESSLSLNANPPFFSYLLS